MTPSEQPVPDANSQDVVEEGATCIRCDYDLRTLRRDGECPECGCPVVFSAGHQVYRVPKYRRWRVWWRLTLNWCPASIVSCVIAAIVVSCLTGWIYDIQWVPLIVIIAATIGFLIATLFTAASAIDLTRIRFCLEEDDSILQRVSGSQRVEKKLRRGQIDRMLESPFIGIDVQSKVVDIEFIVPPETERYNELRAKLALWKPIDQHHQTGRRVFGATTFWTLLCSSFALAMANRGFVACVGLAQLVFLIGYLLLRLLRHPGYTLFSKIACCVWLVGCFAALIWGVWSNVYL